MAGFCITCFSISYCIVVLVSIILFGLSFTILDLNKYGLKKNSYNRKVEKDVVYKPGRYFTGLTGEFIEYPSTWQYINFSKSDGDSSALSGKTKKSEDINLELTLAFRLRPEFLYELNKDYSSLNHKNDMINTVKDIGLKIVNLYEMEQFLQSRHLISNQMSQEIDKQFRQKFNIELTMFLLREIYVQDKFENTYINNLIKSQESITSERENDIKKLDGELEVLKQEAIAEVKAIQQTTNTEIGQILAQANSQGDSEILQSEGKGYAQILALPNWDTPLLLKFINWLKFVKNSNVDFYLGNTQEALIQY